MKPLILFILLSGCASVKYEKANPDGTSETLVINSFFRSLQGLNAKRGDFVLIINKAQPTVTPEDIAEALRLFKPL
jgi:predicted oxidoreductase